MWVVRFITSGRAHTSVGAETLKAVAGSGCTGTRTPWASVPIDLRVSRCGWWRSGPSILWDRVCLGYAHLEFDAACGDEVFPSRWRRDRLVEPSSKLETAQVLGEV